MDNRLIDAVRKNDRAQVIVLLAAGVPVDTRGSHGQTALMRAAGKGNNQMLNLLLNTGAMVNKSDMWGEFPLSCASDGNHLATAQILIAHGADVNFAGNSVVNALMSASGHGYTKIAALLIAEGANVNVQARASGETALIRAVYFRKYDCVKLLLAHGASKAPKDVNGETAVTYARKNKDSVALKLLGG